MSSRTVIFHLALFCAFLAACAGGGKAGVPALVEDGKPTAEYVIGPGDTLNVFIWGHDDLSTDVQVRPDGRITTPLVEDMVAAGKTSTTLARDIEKALEEYINTPIVTVMLRGFVGEFEQQIRVVGQAAQPQSLPYRNGITLLDVMIQVGGLSEFASGNKAKIVRRIGDKEEIIRVRIDDLLNKGKIEENVRMVPGDVLIIPESMF